jgi:hypothetical protein
LSYRHDITEILLKGALNTIIITLNTRFLIVGRRLLIPNVTSAPPIKVTAFYAQLSQTEHAPSTHHTLIFDTVKTNQNGKSKTVNFQASSRLLLVVFIVSCILQE